MITREEKLIIQLATREAACWGCDVIRGARNEILDYGFSWDEEKEKYTMEHFEKIISDTKKLMVDISYR